MLSRIDFKANDGRTLTITGKGATIGDIGVTVSAGPLSERPGWYWIDADDWTGEASGVVVFAALELLAQSGADWALRNLAGLQREPPPRTESGGERASVVAAAEALAAARLPFRSLAPHDFEPIRETAEAALHEAEMRLDASVKALHAARA